MADLQLQAFSVAHNDEIRELDSPAHVSLAMPAQSEGKPQRILHKVPQQVREDKKHIYDPVVLSLGPYHYGQPKFRLAEELKVEVLNIVCGAKDKSFLHRKILEQIDEIRHFYGGLSKDKYDDEALAEMMLRDACFILYYMMMTIEREKDEAKYSRILHRLGMSGVAFMFRDFFMLENQIPLWLIKLLISSKGEGEALLYNFLSVMCFAERRLERIPWENNEEPLHLLEAVSKTLVKKDKSSADESNKDHSHRKSSESKFFETASSPFRSVTELKAKGIQFEPSSNCLEDIRFHSYPLYGKLQLRIWYFTNISNVFFSNVIAFEMSPETDTDFAVTSYVDFMKSLIKSPKDVKELREKDILFSRLANDEEVVRMFKEIDTYGSYNEDIFQDVKTRIGEHCNSKAKTWMAELIHTYFRSPWTTIALFAATFLLCLSFLQTYYTMVPRNSRN